MCRVSWAFRREMPHTKTFRECMALAASGRAMSASSTVLQRLEAETREHHAEADAAWLGLMGHDVTKHQYVRRLIDVYGFESPLEGSFAYTPGLDHVLPLR